MLRHAPSPEARALALEHSTDRDRLAINRSELFWLPAAGVSDSDLDWKALQTILGSMTVRTERTLQRMAAKYL